MSEEKARKPIVKFVENLPPKDLTFKFDTGYEIPEHEGTTKDGKKFKSRVQYLHTVVYNGVESVVYFDKYVNDKIVALNPKDKVLRIGKVKGEADKYWKWSEIVVVGEAPKAVAPAPVAQTPAIAPKAVIVNDDI